MAFEANPINFRKMAADPELKFHAIEVHPHAIAKERGTAGFHVIDVDYDDPTENTGISSLLVYEGLKVKETIQVETRRIDELILDQHPASQKVALWIDVEGAEYGVIEGMERIRDRVQALHVETAKRPIRVGQRTLADVSGLLNAWGFLECGTNIGPATEWGDVVFVNETLIARLGWRFSLCRFKGHLTHWMGGSTIAVYLKSHFPPLYRGLRKLYLWLGT